MIQNNLLISSLRNFYKQNTNKQRLLSILSNDNNISLRSIDWFITNYSKKHNIYYSIYKKRSGNTSFYKQDDSFRSNINVFHSYKSQLKAYSKKQFDPFCRRDRILFNIDKETSVETTIGQLNFFKWAFSNLIIEYIEENKEIIEDDMNTCLKVQKKEYSDKKTNSRKKRQELSLSATRGLNKIHVPILLEFN